MLRTYPLQNPPAGRGTARPQGSPALGRRALLEEERRPLASRAAPCRPAGCQCRLNHCQGDEGSPNLQLPALTKSLIIFKLGE